LLGSTTALPDITPSILSAMVGEGFVVFAELALLLELSGRKLEAQFRSWVPSR
jgi:hypothetical protein